MTQRVRFFLAVLVVSVGMVAAVGGSYALALQALNQSQHQWCATLTLLTRHPVPRPADPKANPSREQAFVFYTQLLALRHEFGCD
jgi:hypothetical protein